ncbi:MAG: hypothetical protein HY021_07635 [Burkholderiales bacterium]|nr:hypothetical protein [Burkholderiales bacterium]
MPLALLAAALVAALLIGHSQFPGLLAGFAMLLTALACALAGALWNRHKHTARIAETRLQMHQLVQLVDGWLWQTDREHRLIRLQPPQGAPGSSWAAGGPSGQLLWDRFIDPEGTLAQRMAAHSALAEMAVRHGPGDAQRPWRLRGLPRHDAQGEFAGYIGIARPDEAPAAQQADADAQALAAEHAAFSYTISHDLRAPIRVVEGFTRILKEDYGRLLDRIGNDHLERVMGAAARMSHMIDALLALSQLTTQPLQRQPVNLSQVAQFILDDLHRHEPERQVAVTIQPGLMTEGDPTLLRMALENLLGNAWKYSAQCSPAEIGFEQARQPGGGLAYVVRDNGAGFDMRFADRLFGVFQRLHSSSEFPGTGVGLASVRRIIKRHGGHVWAESEVGQGARFFFTVP